MINEELEDWQRGNDSRTSPLERVDLMTEWLKKNKSSILESLVPEKTDRIIGGFEDLPMYE